MSTLNAALTYKLQKMERTLSSLMEENRALRNIINEANYAGMSVDQAFGIGGGAEAGKVLTAHSAMGPVGVGKMGTMSGPGAGALPMQQGPQTTAAARTVAAQPSQGLIGQYTGGQGLGALLASLEGNPQAQQIVQQFFGLPSSAATSTGVPTTQRRR